MSKRPKADLKARPIEYLLDNRDQARFPKLTDEQLERLRPIGSIRAVSSASSCGVVPPG